MIVALGVSRVFYFCFVDPWRFHRSLSPSAAAVEVYVFCCTAVLHGGWVHRFVGLSVAIRSAVLL